MHQNKGQEYFVSILSQYLIYILKKGKNQLPAPHQRADVEPPAADEREDADLDDDEQGDLDDDVAQPEHALRPGNHVTPASPKVTRQQRCEKKACE